MKRRALGAALLGLSLLAVGCSSGPTLDDARDLLHEGEPQSALAAAREAARRAQLPEERIELRRVAFRAALGAGWSHEAAREYAILRELLGREDDDLLQRLGEATLRLALVSPDAGRRLRAVRSLELAGELPRFRAFLDTALEDPEPEVRMVALEVAARSGPPATALTEVQALAADDPDARVREGGLRALLALGERLRAEGRTRQPLLAPAVGALGDPAERVRLAGLDLLASLAQETPLRAEADAALRKALAQGSDPVRLEAGRRLLALDPVAAAEAWRTARVPARGTLGPFGRALALHPARPRRAALEQVREDLRGPYRVRLAAVQGLVGPGARSLRRELLTLAADDPAASVRATALRALAAGDPSLARRGLRLGLEHRHPATRRAAFLLREAREPWSTPQLVARFEAGDPALSDDAARLLCARGGEAGMQALLQGLQRDPTRLPALAALAELGDPRQRPLFQDFLGDPDPRVRRLAAAGLAACGELPDRLPLTRALEDPTQGADLPAGAALLSIQARRPAPAPPRAAPE